MQKETEFDFSKDSRKEPIKKDWTVFIQPPANFIQRHKKWFITGISAFLVFQGINYILADSPQEEKTKVIAMQMATEKIPDVLKDLERSKQNYDEIVVYLMEKEYEIKTNSMEIMQRNVRTLDDANVQFKKYMNKRKDTLEIINAKIKETKNHTLLTKEERNIVLEEYSRVKAGDTYISTSLNKLIHLHTTVQNDEKPTDVKKIEELEKERNLIKQEVSEIQKRNVKRMN